MSRTRVLVADALPIFRTGVRSLLMREGDFAVVEAGSRSEALATLAEHQVDLALIDIDLPPKGGVEAAGKLAEAGVQSIVWAFNPEAETVLEAIRAGACGVLDKRIAAPALIRSLRGVMQGEAPLARDLTSRMIAAIHTLEQTQRARDRAAVLSTREREILEFVAQGAHNKQIASALTISEFTVKRHVQNILRKLELPSRRAAGGIYLAAYGPERALSANGRSV